VQASGQPEAAREDLGGVVHLRGELVEQGAVRVEGLLDGGVEQLLPALEVVVERAVPDLRDLAEAVQITSRRYPPSPRPGFSGRLQVLGVAMMSAPSSASRTAW